MKKLSPLLILFATIFPSIPLHAGDSVTVPWERICAASAEHDLHVTTSAGDTWDGYCVSVDVNEVSVNANGKIVRIARDSVNRIMMTPQRHQLRSLGRGVRKGLSVGVRLTFSPAAPAGLVTIPATLAWGAVALPFCAIGDIAGPREHPAELIIYDPKPGPVSRPKTQPSAPKDSAATSPSASPTENNVAQLESRSSGTDPQNH